MTRHLWRENRHRPYNSTVSQAEKADKYRGEQMRVDQVTWQ
jgi:hypothetical protein